MRHWQMSGGDAAGKPAELRIYGDIAMWWDDITAAAFAQAVDAVQAKELDVYINSFGGSAFDGLAMYHALRRFAARGTLRTHNDGIVASAAVAPYLAGDVRFAPAGSVLMIHQGKTGAWGEAEEIRKTAEALDKLNDAVAEMYAQRTGKNVEEIKAMMAATTYMTPVEQIDHGFATDKSDGEAAIDATMHGAVLMCGGQQIDMQKLPGMPASVLASMLCGGKPAEAPTVAPEQSGKVVQHAGAAGQKGEGPKMDLEKLKAEHPELVATVMAMGADAERQRIADIQQHAPKGFEQDAQAAIDHKLSPEAFAMAVLKKQKEQGATFLQQREAQASADGGANNAPNAPGVAPAAQQDANMAVFMAAATEAAKAKAGKK